MSLTVDVIPALFDNYIFLVHCTETGERTVIDPGETAPVVEALGNEDLDLVLLTHHHEDHIGGAEKLMFDYDCPILGGTYDETRGVLPPLARSLEDGDRISIGKTGTVMEIPGHTLGHLAFYFPEDRLLFCGDTLFAGGCGRMFEGDAEMLFNSLQKFKELPPTTKVYCAHEYTLKNYQFAHEMFPDDKDIEQRLVEVHKRRRQNLPTIPSTLGEEFRTNIFLRAKTVGEFADLRQKKDGF